MFLSEELIKLLWKVLEKGKANKEHLDNQQNEFLKVASKAVRRTLSYIREENKKDTKTEEELSDLWAEVALAARPFNSNLAERCYLKGNYWANPNSWSNEEVKNAGIELERIETEIRNLFKSKIKAKKSKQQKTIKKTAKFSNEKFLTPKRNNQELLSKIIKALNELKEALTQNDDSTRTQKAREAVRYAMSPLEETYDFLHQSIRANCNSCTETCMNYIKNALISHKKGYPALWDSLAKPEFIYELNLAKTELESKDTKKEEQGMITPKPPEFLQKLLWIRIHGGKHWKIILLAAIILVVFFYLKVKLENYNPAIEQSDIPKTEIKTNVESKIIGDSSPTIITSGHNSPVTINYDLSENMEETSAIKAELTNIENKITKLAEQLQPQLTKQYSKAHTVFGIYQDGFVHPKGLMPENLEIDWDTGRVQITNGNVLIVTLPNMTLNGKTFVCRNKTFLAKRIGAKSGSTIKLGWFDPRLEVIGIDKELVVVALGFSVDDLKK